MNASAVWNVGSGRSCAAPEPVAAGEPADARVPCASPALLGRQQHTHADERENLAIAVRPLHCW